MKGSGSGASAEHSTAEATGRPSIGVPLVALTPWLRLHDAIALAGGTPCAGPDRDDWTGTAPEQARAADACLDCPVMSACAAYADAAEERSGVWGGRTERDRRSAPRPARSGRGSYSEALLRRVLAMRDGGATLRAIADTLTAEGVPTPRGGAWRGQLVRYVLGLARNSAQRAEEVIR